MDNINFIACPQCLCGEFDYNSPAPIFRRHFLVEKGLNSAVLKVCALGLGKFYFNGKPLTDDLYISPFSDYTKTLWFNEYDVTDKLSVGENLVAVALGNGFYNENLSTGWDFDKAPWRDSPKFYFCLELNYFQKKEYVISDTEWLCNFESSPYRFNQFRMGEIFDYNYKTDWMEKNFDDSSWSYAVVADKPSGIMRRCPASPIKEDSVFECRELFKNRYGEWVFDFGQNLSGYIRLCTKQPKGTKLHVVYAEQLDFDARRKDNRLAEYFYDGETQFSTVITGDKAIDWKPDFTYYGFRYVIISGFQKAPSIKDVQAIFVHQDIAVKGHFRCSDEFLNSMYRMSRMSTLSNCFNMPTDCPTREKLGWCNDAQASCEQMIQNFEMTAFFEKWMQDIKDAQKENGDLPGIVPTGGWGYAWGSGPVSTGILFEIPFRLYQYNGNKKMLCDTYPYMIKHLDFLETKINPENGLIEHGLDDWAGPWEEGKGPVPRGFICTALYIRFCNIAEMAAHFLGNDEYIKDIINRRERLLANFKRNFINPDGSCRIEEQTAIALLIVNRFYDDLAPLKKQLINTIEKYDFHFHVGMVGIQYILPALDICGLNAIGYRLLTASGYPSYRSWLDAGATTLHEMFGDTMSCNHHMYSCVIAWFHNVILGIRYDCSVGRSNTIVLKPCFLENLSFASGSFKTACGTVSVEWIRISEGKIELCIDLSDEMSAELILDDYLAENKKQQFLNSGKHQFVCEFENSKI